MTTYQQRRLETVEADQWDGSPEHAITVIEWVKTINPNALITYDDHGLVQPPRSAPVIRAQTKFGTEAVQEDGWIAVDSENNLRVYTTEQFDAIFETLE